MEPEAQVRQLLDARDVHGAASAAIRGLGPQVLRYLRSVLSDETDAAEAFSGFAERLWTGLPDFEWRASLRTWALRLAWHAALDLRDEAWRRRTRRLRTTEASSLADEVRLSSGLRQEERHTALARLRAELAPEEQALLALRIDQGLSWDEVAEVLTTDAAPVKVNTLVKRYERLRQRLAERALALGLVEPG